MEPKKGLLLSPIVAFICLVSLWAQSTPPRLTPSEFAVQLGKTPAPLSVPLLIEASLKLSGADPGTVASGTVKLDTMILEAKQAVSSDHSAYSKGNALLLLVHKNILNRYSEPQTRLDTLLATGEYNCVSSAVLYMILGRAVGLDVEGVYTPDHAFCTVKEGGRLVDVETTNRFGFDPGSKTAFHDAFGNTGFTYVPPGNYRLRTATDGKGLLSFILQNRMSLLERRYRFSEAIGLAVDRRAILGTKASLDDLASEVNNYCALLNQQGRYSEAITFLDRFEKVYGTLPQLEKVMAGLIHNEVLRLSNDGQFVQAMALIRERQAQASLDPQALASLKQIVTDGLLSGAVRTLPFEKALAEIQQSYRRGEISESTYNRYLVAVFGREAQKTATSDGYLAAVKILDRGIKMTGGDSQLQRGKQVYLNNYVVTIHNRFAELFNRQDYTQAAGVVSEGLKAVPDSSVLIRDRQLLRQAQMSAN